MSETTQNPTLENTSSVVQRPTRGFQVDYTFVTIPDWDALLNQEPVMYDGYHDGSYIIAPDGEESVSPDGLGGDSQNVMNGVVQQKERVIGQFQIRRGSGILVVSSVNGEEMPFPFAHIIKSSLDAVEHYGTGPSREEIWSFLLEYGRAAELHSWEPESDSPRQTQVDLSDDLEYDDVREYLTHAAWVELPEYDHDVFYETGGRFYFHPDDASDLSDVQSSIQILEEKMDVKRRNAYRVGD